MKFHDDNQNNTQYVRMFVWNKECVNEPATYLLILYVSIAAAITMPGFLDGVHRDIIST